MRFISAEAPESRNVPAEPRRPVALIIDELALTGRARPAKRTLLREHDFDLAVITVPTAVRLHGRPYKSFPEISDRLYFLDLVRELSAAVS